MNILTILAGIAGTVLSFGGTAAIVRWLWTRAGEPAQQRRHELAIKRLDIEIETARAPIAPGATAEHYAPHITYSPHITTSHTSAQTCQEPIPQPLVRSAIPTFIELLTRGQIGHRNPLCLGYDLDTGKPVEADWRGLYSSGLGGLQGSGKTWTAAFLLSQSVLNGARLIVIDPHAGDTESLATRIEPLRSAFLADVATDEHSIITAMQIATDELHRREQGAARRWACIVVVDEWTALLLRENLREKLPRFVAQISTQGRKYNVHCLLLAQRWAIDDSGGGLVRNTLTSAYVHRMRRDEARMLSGMGRATPDDTISLEPGQAYLCDTRGSLTRVQIPQMTTGDMATIGGMLQRGSANAEEAVWKPIGSQLEAREKATLIASQSQETTSPDVTRATALFLQGLTPAQVVKEMRGVSSSQGAKYQRALDEVLMLIREGARGGHQNEQAD